MFTYFVRQYGNVYVFDFCVEVRIVSSILSKLLSSISITPHPSRGISNRQYSVFDLFSLEVSSKLRSPWPHPHHNLFKYLEGELLDHPSLKQICKDYRIGCLCVVPVTWRWWSLRWTISSIDTVESVRSPTANQGTSINLQYQGHLSYTFLAFLISTP